MSGKLLGTQSTVYFASQRSDVNVALMAAMVDNGMFRKKPLGPEGLAGTCYYQRTAENKQLS